MAVPEHLSHIAPDRTTSLKYLPELRKQSIIVGSDIEGPWYIGDFIADAMKNMLRPKNGIDASPSYGQIIYQQSWEAFTEDTIDKRRPPDIGRPKVDYSYSLSQEGTDTIFTLPLLLAAGADYSYLEDLTVSTSKQTPGSKELLKSLDKEGIFVIGITTAPQEPYRALVKRDGLIDPKRVMGSPFPIDETRRLLEKSGRLEEELSMVKSYLTDCYALIDRYSTITNKNGEALREFSPEGQKELQARIRHFHDQELGITYDPLVRKSRLSPTLLGQVIERIGMVGDRAKAAVATYAFRKTAPNNGSLLVTMGDGANDSVMLKKAPISIGINGPDAAKAAKIGIVTDSMMNLFPIYEQLANGERDVFRIVEKTREKVDSSTIIHIGGSKVPEEILMEHKNMKKKLRGQNITY